MDPQKKFQTKNLAGACPSWGDLSIPSIFGKGYQAISPGGPWVSLPMTILALQKQPLFIVVGKHHPTLFLEEDRSGPAPELEAGQKS
jgi:hypothetical protein